MPSETALPDTVADFPVADQAAELGERLSWPRAARWVALLAMLGWLPVLAVLWKLLR